MNFETREERGEFMRSLFLGLILAVCHVASTNAMIPKVSPKSIDLISITSDVDKLPSVMYVILDDNHDITEFGKKDLDAKGRVIARTIFSTELDINGVVLKKKKGRKILIMRGHNIGPIYGGGLELDFLYNGITGSRKSFHVELVRQDNTWSVKVKDRTVSHLNFKVHRKRFVGVVGIRKVEIIK